MLYNIKYNITLIMYIVYNYKIYYYDQKCRESAMYECITKYIAGGATLYQRTQVSEAIAKDVYYKGKHYMELSESQRQEIDKLNQAAREFASMKL